MIKKSILLLLFVMVGCFDNQNLITDHDLKKEEEKVEVKEEKKQEKNDEKQSTPDGTISCELSSYNMPHYVLTIRIRYTYEDYMVIGSQSVFSIETFGNNLDIDERKILKDFYEVLEKEILDPAKEIIGMEIFDCNFETVKKDGKYYLTSECDNSNGSVVMQKLVDAFPELCDNEELNIICENGRIVNMKELMSIQTQIRLNLKHGWTCEKRK